MSPSKLSPFETLQTTSDLSEAGVKHTIKETAPSIIANGHSNGLQELDASKLTFTRNTNPKAVPEPKSPEVTAMTA